MTLVLKTVTEVAEFWGTLLSGVEKAAEEYGVELKVLTSPREIDIDKQIELIRQVTADKPDVRDRRRCDRHGRQCCRPRLLCRQQQL